MSSNVVYTYQRNTTDTVPENVQKLIIDQRIRSLGGTFLYHCERLREVVLPRLLKRIGDGTFLCRKLLKIRIGNRVRFIGREAFGSCRHLKKVEFEDITVRVRVPRMTIDERAFENCTSLSRIKLPVTIIAIGAFHSCRALVEADLSKTRLTEISNFAFHDCLALQTVSLPKTLEQISIGAFSGCSKLLTVVVPLDSQSICIREESFHGCMCLANLVLPEDSTAEEDAFRNCIKLHIFLSDIGGSMDIESADIVAGLISRFDDHPVHRMCYDHSAVSAQEFRQSIEEQFSLVDKFGLTPFHIFLSTVNPRMDLLEILLDQYPYPRIEISILDFKDIEGKRPLDYLLGNWTVASVELLQCILEKWMVDQLVKWGCLMWAEEMRTKVGAVLLPEHDNEQRVSLLNEVYSSMRNYEKRESTSILEIALWKEKLKSGRSNDGSKRQALDRGECRCLCGSDIVIPNVTPFLWA